eukprot:2440976-Amphidinium_carterae.1
MQGTSKVIQDLGSHHCESCLDYFPSAFDRCSDNLAISKCLLRLFHMTLAVLLSVSGLAGLVKSRSFKTE